MFQQVLKLSNYALAVPFSKNRLCFSAPIMSKNLLAQSGIVFILRVLLSKTTGILLTTEIETLYELKHLKE